MSNKLAVTEVFGPTIEGEGALAGCLTHFVRLGGCDYLCSWCDTLYAVIPEQVKRNSKRMTVPEIVSMVEELPQVRWCTISGGNPFIHKRLPELVLALQGTNYHVNVETQGSVYNDAAKLCEMLTLSPKPPSSEMVTNFTMLQRIAQAATHDRCIKIVAFDVEDLQYIQIIRQMFPHDTIYIQPGTPQLPPNTASDAERRDAQASVTKHILQEVQKFPDLLGGNTRILPQLHSLIWPNTRGV